jgi:hypothetical protein
MPQGPLSSANVVQAKTGSAVDVAAAEIVLDSGTQAGSTVTIELWAGGVPFTDGGLSGVVPAGFETDAVATVGSPATKFLYVFRKRDTAAGEGVAGSTSWDFAFLANNFWVWRATEWDTGLEPAFPMEAAVANWVDNAPATMSTGTPPTTSRANTVGLACHFWLRPSGNGTQATWSSWTNGFTERDQFRADLGAVSPVGVAFAWSWLFATATGTFETTASRDIGVTTDDEAAMLVVYAATTYA